MRLFVFGATGGCGRHVLALARERGHHVTAFVRRGSPFQAPAGVRVVVGDLMSDAPDALDSLAGHDAVLSCLGNRRANQRNPWSPLASPVSFTSESARRVVAAMKAAKVKRVVAISAAGVADSAPGLNAVMRFLLATSAIGPAYRDLEVMEAVYRESGLDWCCIRPTALTSGKRTGKTREIFDFPLTARISRADVAGWMLDAVARERFEDRTPTITAA
jgi:putative NADH-flavin reductase